MCGDGVGMGTNVRGAGGCGVTTPTPCKTLEQYKTSMSDGTRHILMNFHLIKCDC